MKLGGGAGAPSQQQQRVRQHHSPPPPRPDYAALLSRRRAPSNGGRPALFLAPMENLADAPMRIALAAAAGGFDEAVTEFIRIPAVAQRPAAAVKGATRGYDAHELSQWGGGTPLAAQLMGSCPELLAMAARRLAVDLGAPRIDLNLGCPANSVTGNGAGSTLLKTPERIEKLVASMVAAVEGAAPVTVKLRAGFDDASLLDDNLLAAQAGGAAFVALHPRTKRQAYAGAADWRLIARAKEVLDIPVVGNGDVVDAASALRLVRETGCDGIMVGRGAISDPLIFLRIRAAFGGTTSSGDGGSNSGDGSSSSSSSNGSSSSGAAAAAAVAPDEAAVVCNFLDLYMAAGPDGAPGGAAVYSDQARLGRLKKVLKYLLSGSPALRAACGPLLRAQLSEAPPNVALARAKALIREHWRAGGPNDPVLVNHMAIKQIGGGGGSNGAAAAALGNAAWQPLSSGSESDGGGEGVAAPRAAAGAPRATVSC